MTNKFYRKDATINVYVANLAEYNDGKLVGDWISLPINGNDFKDFLKTIGNPEEIEIHDYENNSDFDCFEIGEYSSIKDLNEVVEALEEIKNKGLVKEFNSLYEALEDFEKTLEYFECGNYVLYDGMTMEEVAQECIKEYCYIPAFLENYIDYKSYAHDMECDGLYHKTSYGIIEIL